MDCWGVFFKKSWKTDISRQKSWKSHEILPQTISFVHDMWLWQSSSLHLYKFTTFYLYYIVSGSGCEGRPSLFSKELLWLKCTFS